MPHRLKRNAQSPDMFIVDPYPPNIEQLAEDFWMRRLDRPAAQAFRAHCASCPVCGREADRQCDIILAIRDALTENPPLLIHKCAPVVFD